MWTSISITAVPVWDDVLWHAAATWRDDDGADPIVLVRSGTTPTDGAIGARDLLTAALRGLNGALDDPGARSQEG